MEIEGEEFVREIKSCHHLFHASCIERWLAVKELCPLCKTGLSKYDLAPEKYGSDPNREEEEITNLRIGIEIQELERTINNSDISDISDTDSYNSNDSTNGKIFTIFLL